MVVSSENIQLENKLLAKTGTSGNSVSNIVLGLVHHVLGNLVWTYNINKTEVDKDDQRLVIITAT